jgi:His/Glu/Gln/Arg/opine family amino acid ABC transporter permease subunit
MISWGVRLFRILLASACFAIFVVTASAQGYLDQIRAKGELVVATDATYPPFESKNKQDEIVGFDCDVAAGFAKALGVKLKIVNLEWAGVLGALESGKADLVMAGVTITAERKSKGYLFSRPYFLSGQVIVRRKGDTRIQKPEDLKDKMVAVQAETTGQFAVERIGVPKSRTLKFDQLQDGLLDTVNSKSDATVADLPAVQGDLKQGYAELEVLTPPFVKENLGVVAWKTHPELAAFVNRELSHMMVDGTYSAAYQKWFEEPYTTSLVAELDRVSDQGSSITYKLDDAQKLTGIKADQQKPTGAFAFRWDLLGEALPRLAVGARMTLVLTALSLVFGVSGGLVLALARLAPVKIFKPFAVAYVELVRGTPLLMQIYVIYFVLPAFGVHLDGFISGVLALSLNAAAYSSEIFRAGIESIDGGQMEAAKSLGMGFGSAMRWVMLPQTIRRVLPPLTNEAVALLKDSSLVSVVALSELMRVGKEIATNSGSPTTVYLSVALAYLVMTLPLTWLVRRLEARWTVGGRA